MQIMSSPSMSDAADTPVSGSLGSASPQSPGTATRQILDFNKKEKDCPETTEISTKLVETAESERSVNSSPATLVPTPRSTPPMNGILTPPNDVEGNAESTKSVKPGGRLKFFKDGVLCLELTHHGEGERTKWVQIRSKTVFPTLVHAIREATIPCHSTPSSFASPSSLTHNHRVESSTSHSLSDDACSMLSSPRARESHWKQPVPQRGVSACLQFFMKPAPCSLKIRGKLKDLCVSQDQFKQRWPYNFRRTDIFIKLKNKNSVQCCCDEISRVLTDSSISGNNNNDSGDEKVCSKEEEKNGTSKIKVKARKVEKTTLMCVVARLEAVAKTQCKVRDLETKSLKSNGDSSDFAKKAGSLKHHVVTPKKRLFNEMEPKESASVRPKKKSPHHRSQDVARTILNVPGLNSEFYKRHASPRTSRSPGQNSPLTANDDFEQRNRSSKSTSETMFHKRSTRSPHFGAKSTSPGAAGNSMLKPGLTAELVDQLMPYATGRTTSRYPNEQISPKHQHLQEQKYLQQQTVSKAISYTINSLLGNAAVTSESLASPQSKRMELTGQTPQKEIQSAVFSNSNQHRGNSQSSPLRHVPSARPDQDQKSFLRHLLDTSDPIPSNPLLKSTDHRPSKSISRPSSNHHNTNSVSKSVSANSNHEVATNSTYSTSKHFGNSKINHPTVPQEISNKGRDSASEAQQTLAANLALSSLMSTFPLGLSQSYDLLARSANANQHSTDALTAAAAAAAALQYGSLFSPVNNQMAAAMAASYFGMMPVPNFPLPSTTPTNSKSPPPKASTRRNPEPFTSQAGTTNGHPSISSPSFRSPDATSAANSRNSSLRTPSAISSVSATSCGALNLSSKKKSQIDESIDMDAPLDLCKKSTR